MRPIRSGARQNDANGLIAPVVCQCREKVIDRKVWRMGGIALDEHKFVPGNPHRLVRRDHVNVIALHGHAVHDFRDGNFCEPGKNFC